MKKSTMKVRVTSHDDDVWYRTGEEYEVHNAMLTYNSRGVEHRYYPLVDDTNIGIGPEHCEIIVDETKEQPKFPFKVRCINDDGAEGYLEAGKTYTALSQYWDDMDYMLEGVTMPWSRSRFEIISDEAVVEEVDHISEAQNTLKELKKLNAQVYVPDPEEEKRVIDAHYSFNYTLTEKDREVGSIKVDPYFVAKQWRLGSKDDTGVLFHCLKNISRYSDKNTKEREITALYLQVKRLAEIEGVKLD